MDAITFPPAPINEPNLTYAPGSPEREALRVELEKLERRETDLKAHIGGRRKAGGGPEHLLVQPHDHQHVLGRFTGATQADAGSTDRSPLMDIFVQGKIGMQIGLPPTVGQIAEGNPDLDYSIVPIPTEDGSPVTLGVADHLMAFDNGDDAKKEAITAFFDYFYSADVYTTWVQAEGFLPTTTSGSEALSGEEALKPFLDLLPDAQFYPTTNPKWDATNAAFKSLIGQIAQGKDPAAVLTEIQAMADAE